MARPRKHPLPTIAELRYCFDYDPATGNISTRARDGDDAYILAFNRRYAGRVVGSVMNTGYRWIRVPGYGTMLGHRLAWAIHHGRWPTEIDHRDGDKLNNRLDNLREVTRAQNNHNRPTRARSGYKGVKARGRKWVASIKADGRHRYLGTFASRELAHEAYQRAARAHHGDYLNLKVIPVGFISAAVMFAITAS